jgi:multiple sugar transport system permease protein
MKRRANELAIAAALLYTAVVMFPIAWMAITAIKHPSDTALRPPRFIPASESPPQTYKFEVSALNFSSQFKNPDILGYLLTSVFVAAASTIVSVFLGAFAAYGFSRFRLAGSNDWQFFILSTRMLPALAVSVPISWMYAKANQWTGMPVLMDSPLGLILLYTCFNLSFSTWMMKAFIDEIPSSYEEAALLDGYSRAQVLFRIILPQASTGLLATAVFCLIAAWNEYAFALTLTQTNAVTMPVYLHGVIGDTSKVPWGRLAAGASVFMLPIVVFSLLMRKHLLRGITFGAVKG